MSKNVWLLVIFGTDSLELRQLSVRGSDEFRRESDSLCVPLQIVRPMLGQLVATPDARRVMNFGLTYHNRLWVGSDSRRVSGVISVPWQDR